MFVHFFSPEKIFQIFRDYNTIQRRRIGEFEKKYYYVYGNDLLLLVTATAALVKK